MLIVFLCILTSGMFEDKSILLLDSGVLIICWTLSLYIFGGLFASQEDFSNEFPATGIKLYLLWSYCPLAILCIYGGYAHKIPFSWQLFIQAILLFIVLIGLVLSKASVERLAEVESQSNERHASKDSLSVMAQQMSMAASLNQLISPEVKKEISKFTERVGYISPSNSPTAVMQEGMLRKSIGRLSLLVQSDASSDQLYKELEDAKTILSQRLKTY